MPLSERTSRARTVWRWVLVAFYAIAGAAHLRNPQPFLGIMPGWVPWPEAVVALTGVAELLGAIGLANVGTPSIRRAAAWGLAAYALCVWPANFNHMLIDLARTDGGGLSLAYHIPRLAAQPLLVWLALWTGEVTDWPFRR